MLLTFITNLGMGGTVSGAPPPIPPAVVGAVVGGKVRRKERPLIRFMVELGEDKHYFWTESEAITFLRRQAHVVVRRAKALARKTHRIRLPEQRPIALPELQPLPRFIVQGSQDIQALSHQINAQIDAVLANPEYEGDLDDEDITRLLQ